MRKRILKAAEVFCLSVALCISVVGCSGKDNEQLTSPEINISNESDSSEDIEVGDSSGATGKYEEIIDSSTESNNEVEGGSEMPDGSKEEGSFYDGANLSGRVVDFSDTGFTITPRTMVINEDGTMEGGIAAPGYESEETNIHITYAEDVVFQIIYFGMGSQSEISREDTDKNSIKKETDVNIFGTCQDEKNWIANKVVITRWQ
jgi:hypothetical protein